MGKAIDITITIESLKETFRLHKAAYGTRPALKGIAQSGPHEGVRFEVMDRHLGKNNVQGVPREINNLKKFDDFIEGLYDPSDKPDAGIPENFLIAEALIEWLERKVDQTNKKPVFSKSLKIGHMGEMIPLSEVDQAFREKRIAGWKDRLKTNICPASLVDFYTAIGHLVRKDSRLILGPIFKEATAFFPPETPEIPVNSLPTHEYSAA